MGSPIRRPSDVPEVRRAELQIGVAESRCLAEWLAVDTVALLLTVRPGLRTSMSSDELTSLTALGTVGRLRRIGEVLALTRDVQGMPELLSWLQRHDSDLVRQWGPFVVAGIADLSLVQRIEATAPFALDRNMSVRECAWMALRPAVAANLRIGIQLLSRKWITSNEANLRRCAVETTRPRSVWGRHIAELKREPWLGVGLIDPLRDESSRYVQTAVANWLNDASKTQPSWVVAFCQKWALNQGSHTRWTVLHAMRTLRKRGLA